MANGANIPALRLKRPGRGLLEGAGDIGRSLAEGIRAFQDIRGRQQQQEQKEKTDPLEVQRKTLENIKLNQDLFTSLNQNIKKWKAQGILPEVIRALITPQLEGFRQAGIEIPDSVIDSVITGTPNIQDALEHIISTPPHEVDTRILSELTADDPDLAKFAMQQSAFIFQAGLREGDVDQYNKLLEAGVDPFRAAQAVGGRQAVRAGKVKLQPGTAQLKAQERAKTAGRLEAEAASPKGKLEAQKTRAQIENLKARTDTESLDFEARDNAFRVLAGQKADKDFEWMEDLDKDRLQEIAIKHVRDPLGFFKALIALQEAGGFESLTRPKKPLRREDITITPIEP